MQANRNMYTDADYYTADDDPIPTIPTAPPMATDQAAYSELMQFLSQSDEMRKCARSSLRQSLYAGAGALAGALLLGPVGGLVGGVTGSLMGYFRTDYYDGALLTLMNIEGEQRLRLMKEVGKILMVAGAAAQQIQTASAFRDTLQHYATQDHVRDGIWKACMSTIRN